jgi:hypothetical protein
MEGEDYTEPKGDTAKVLVETSCAHWRTRCRSASRATLDRYARCLGN